MEFRILNSFFILSLLWTAFSCTKPVKVEIPGYVEKIVIEGSIETDGFPLVLISKNKNLYAPVSQSEVLNGYLSGAKVWVSDGDVTIQLTEICTQNLPEGMDTLVGNFLGVPSSALQGVNICAYIGTDSNFKGEIGKTYTVTVEYEGETYIASSTIIPPIHLYDSYWKEDTDPEYKDYGLNHHLLKDPPIERNAYMYEVKRLNVDSTGQPKDKRYYKTFMSYFDDEFFNGLVFEMMMDNPTTYDDETVLRKYRGLYQRGDTVEVKFSTYDHEHYRFLNTIMSQKMAGGSPFTLPANADGNFSNGALGAWIAFSPSYTIVVCE